MRLFVLLNHKLICKLPWFKAKEQSKTVKIYLNVVILSLDFLVIGYKYMNKLPAEKR